MALQSVEMPRSRPRRRRCSSRVASGASRTDSAIRSAWGAHLGGEPWRCGVGAVEPVSRRRCFRRRTQAGLTLYLAAASRQDIPASQSASTRWRRSAE